MLYDYATSRPRPVPDEIVARLEAFEGRPLRAELRASAVGGYASKRRKIATAFWPPNPKPLTATVSTFASRATSGT